MYGHTLFSGKVTAVLDRLVLAESTTAALAKSLFEKVTELVGRELPQPVRLSQAPVVKQGISRAKGLRFAYLHAPSAGGHELWFKDGSVTINRVGPMTQPTSTRQHGTNSWQQLKRNLLATAESLRVKAGDLGVVVARQQITAKLNDFFGQRWREGEVGGFILNADERHARGAPYETMRVWQLHTDSTHLAAVRVEVYVHPNGVLLLHGWGPAGPAGWQTYETVLQTELTYEEFKRVLATMSSPTPPELGWVEGSSNAEWGKRLVWWALRVVLGGQTAEQPQAPPADEFDKVIEKYRVACGGCTIRRINHRTATAFIQTDYGEWPIGLTRFGDKTRIDWLMPAEERGRGLPHYQELGAAKQIMVNNADLGPGSIKDFLNNQLDEIYGS